MTVRALGPGRPVLRDQPEALKEAVALTPFSRSEFVTAFGQDAADPVERARQTLVRAQMGFGSASGTVGYATGFRANSNRSGTTPAKDWMHYPDFIPVFAERLRGVTIECADAARVMRHHDSPRTLHYVDPPYDPAVRQIDTHRSPAYEHEMTRADHEALAETLRAATCLPADGWHQRIQRGEGEGACEGFLQAVREQAYARAPKPNDPYSLEVELRPATEALVEAAAKLDGALERLLAPMERLLQAMRRRLDDEAEQLDSDTRRRIEATCRALERRGVAQAQAWRAMLDAVRTGQSPEAFVDWLMVERAGGQDIDVGFHRHWVDPTVPFAEHVATPAQGLVVTSATLRDGSGDPEADWRAAELRTGGDHIVGEPIRAAVPSPFDYAGRTRVFVVRDVRKDDLDQVGAAYRELFQAAGGGALGLFTAIQRLRGVHARIGAPLEDAGLPLFAQHVDGLDVATLVDIFRAETDACLLGTDAVRDGVDVPGRALRCIVFDRVPWPRPDIRHKARRQHFGGKRYDEMLTRLRLKQAYGRLIRRADDAGCFVLLDSMFPSRMEGAFPEGVQVTRCGLAEAVAGVRGFLAGV